jgi:hypothetical protein
VSLDVKLEEGGGAGGGGRTVVCWTGAMWAVVRFGVGGIALGYREAEHTSVWVPEDRSKGWGVGSVGEGTTTSSSVTPSASESEAIRPIETSRLRSRAGSESMWWRKRRCQRVG